MKLSVITLVRNEEKIIPYFIHHYKDIVDHIILVDHESTDNTVKIAQEISKKLEVSLSIFTMKNNGYDELMLKEFKENFYKNFKNEFDVVLICDADELWFHKNGTRKIIEDLWKVHNEKLCIKPIGIQMMSESFPEYKGEKITNIIKHGLRDTGFDKISCFSTKLNLSSGYGMHFSQHYDFKGNLINPIINSGMYMLHIKFLGFDYAYSRIKNTKDNLNTTGFKLAEMGIGGHFIAEESGLRKGFFELFDKCKKEGFNLDNI